MSSNSLFTSTGPTAGQQQQQPYARLKEMKVFCESDLARCHRYTISLSIIFPMKQGLFVMWKQNNK